MITAVSDSSGIDVKVNTVLNLDGMTVDGWNALNVRSFIQGVMYEPVGGLYINTAGSYSYISKSLVRKLLFK